MKNQIVNARVNEMMVDKVIEMLQLNSKEDTVLDLFCGVGNFSIPAARYAKRVIGVEVYMIAC